MSLIIKKIKESISETVKSALEELNYLPKKEKIFIKPNIAIPTWPTSPYITNPEIVGGVIDYLKSLGIKDIVVGEGPVPIDFPVEETFDVCGYSAMCREKDVILLNLHKCPMVKVKNNIKLPSIVFEREYINISKMKTHYQTTVSLGLKNQKGLLSPENKNMFHRNLHENIAKLTSLINPSLSLIDGTNGLEGNGPADLGHEVADFNILLGGTSFLAVDQLACTVMGIDYKRVDHLRLAEEKGYNGLEGEIISGEKPETVFRRFQLPSLYWKKGNFYYYWSDYTCSKCSLIEGKIIEEIDKIPLEQLNKLSPVAFITGPPKIAIEENFTIYGLGKCASIFKGKSAVIDGCPPDMNKVINFLYNLFA
jgi:uncharacterized protein (DUF362 family)